MQFSLGENQPQLQLESPVEIKESFLQIELHNFHVLILILVSVSFFFVVPVPAGTRSKKIDLQKEMQSIPPFLKEALLKVLTFIFMLKAAAPTPLEVGQAQSGAKALISFTQNGPEKRKCIRATVAVDVLLLILVEK